MAEARPIVALQNPRPVDCRNCGQGQLHYSFLRPRFGENPRCGFYCTTCSYTVAEPIS